MIESINDELKLKLKLSKEIKRDLVVTTSSYRTYIVCAAVHKNTQLNVVNKIACKKGIPIGGYVYDNQFDCYYYSCLLYTSPSPRD